MQIPLKQKGMALLLFVFVLVLAVTLYTLSALNSSELQRAKSYKTMKALAEAKAALIGWSVSHPLHPGIMPFPDRSLDLNYDGNSDCVTTVPDFNLLIGRLPFLGQTAPCPAASPGIASSLVDGEGEQLWYAVSRNLVRTSAIGALPYQPVINPSIADAPVENWLVVRDKNGQIISERVAVVILAPGAPVAAQNRSGGLAGSSAYLDRITISGTNYGNDDYAVANESFVIADDMQSVSLTDTRYLQPYEFNDKLIFITIDELMVALEKRAMGEAAASLRSYHLDTASQYYPYAGDETNTCIDGLMQGSLSLTPCTGSINFSTYLPDWFSPNLWGSFIYYAVSTNCQLSAPGCASGDITVGAQANVHALVISAGAAITGPPLSQVRPSGVVTDYLDSIENTNGDNTFDAVGTALTNIYNDQMLIVAPL